MTKGQNAWDVIVRSVKTGLAFYAAFMAGGGINVIHASVALQTKLAALGALATAILNTALKLHSAISSGSSASPTASVPSTDSAASSKAV